MKINEALNQISAKLQEIPIENYQAEAYTLLSFICQKELADLISQPEKKLKRREKKMLKDLVKKRTQGWPLAYLIKSKGFYQLEFFVNKHTLIPRPESEIIIEEFLKRHNKNDEKINIIDLGTGSGCLIISLAHVLKNKKNINFYGIDISRQALKVAKKNAKKHKLNKKIKFKTGNLLKPLYKKIKKETAAYYILANLPYLNKEEIESEPSLKMEPRQALDGGKNGLEIYEKLFKQVAQIKKNRDFFLYLEINPWQKDELIEIAKQIFFPTKVSFDFIFDLRGDLRLIVLKI